MIIIIIIMDGRCNDDEQDSSQNYLPRNTQEGWWSQDSDAGLLYYETKGVYPGTDIAAFDLDDTIIKTKSGERDPDPLDGDDWEFRSLETVKAKLMENHRKGIKNVIMTNQNEIGLGNQATAVWMAKVEKVTAELGVPIMVLAAMKYIKPDTAMWDFFAGSLNRFKIIDKSTAVYVGDRAGRAGDIADSDKKFAQNIGIAYNTPEVYFGIPALPKYPTLTGLR